MYSLSPKAVWMKTAPSLGSFYLQSPPKYPTPSFAPVNVHSSHPKSWNKFIRVIKETGGVQYSTPSVSYTLSSNTYVCITFQRATWSPCFTGYQMLLRGDPGPSTTERLWAACSGGSNSQAVRTQAMLGHLFLGSETGLCLLIYQRQQKCCV